MSQLASIVPSAAIGPTAYWYLTRATGMVALLLLTLVVVLGVLGVSGSAASARWPRFTISTLHRDASLLVIVVLVIHVVTTVLDAFAPITLIDAIVPFISAYRPLWLGLGAVAFDLLIALTVTSLIRRRLGYGTWRAIHWLAYISWPVAVLHGLGTGSDSRQTWALALTFLCVLIVLVAVIARVGQSDAVSRRAAVARDRHGDLHDACDRGVHVARSACAGLGEARGDPGASACEREPDPGPERDLGDAHELPSIDREGPVRREPQGNTAAEPGERWRDHRP